jgi:lysophospholipase L1-like esterase
MVFRYNARMTARSLAGGVLFLVLATAAFSQTEPWDPVTFEAGGRAYRLIVRCIPSGSYIVLSDGKRETVLGGAGGDNLFPTAQVAGDRFRVLWVNYQDRRAGLGLYDSRTRTSRVIPLDGLKFAGSPVMIERAGRPLGVVLLGNASDNDDVFFLDLRDDHLENISRTPRSEKGFMVETRASGILVRTETLADRARYLMNFDGRAIFRLLGREPRPVLGRRGRTVSPDQQDCRPANTYAAFGDSITFGVMRMENLEGEEHPELAYPERVSEILATFYGPAFPVNLGVPGEQTYQGALRVHQDLAGVNGLYFLLMMGTNDVIHGYFSVDSSIENLDYIIAAAEERGMRIIISTIPPRKDSFGAIPWILNNIAELNLGIAALAGERSIGFIDTHGAFMAIDPPDGWKALMEDIGGNHPSPAGHTIIATLFADVLAAFPPRDPRNVMRVPSEGPTIRRFRWDPVCESDLACYRVEYGSTPSALESLITTNANTVVFPGFPSHDVYFRVQAVDAAGYRSGFTRIYSTMEKPRTRRGHSLAETDRLASAPVPREASLPVAGSGGRH